MPAARAALGSLLQIATLLAGVPPVSAAEPVFVEARVADASDRSYESAAIWLMDHARASIVLSFYLVRAADNPRHPVDRLLQDLVDARARGVDVTLYLNTKIRGVAPLSVTQAPWVARLIAAGIQVVPLTSTRMVHDKLLIVDGRYVLEGSANWTVGALKSNWESNTVIESEGLAQAKLQRLSRLAHHQTAQPMPPDRELPEAVPLPSVALARDGVLARLAAAADERAFDAYLLLLWEVASQSAQGTVPSTEPAGRPERELSPEVGIFVDLEDFGDALGMPAAWDDTAVRRQVIKVIRRLSQRYDALQVQWTHGADAWVQLTAWPGPMLAVPPALLQQAASSQEGSAVSYLRLLRLRLAGQGIALEELPIEDLVAATGLRPDRLKAARRLALVP